MPVKIQIQLDYRERAILEVLRPMISASGKPELELAPPANLLVGDINLLVIGDLGQTLRQLIIERKSYADLIASVKDGRYKEQKLRLQSACSQNIWPTRFIYLVESGSAPEDQTTPLFYGSWVSMALRDNIPVIRVLSMAEGARFITRLADRLIRDSNDLIPDPRKSDKQYPSTATTTTTSHDGNNSGGMESTIRQIIITPRGQQSVSASSVGSNLEFGTEIGGGEIDDGSVAPHLGSETNDYTRATSGDYTRAVIGSIKTKKGDNMTRELCHKTMLSIIPGISAGLCEQILAGYGGSLSQLIRSLELVEGGTETKESRIAGLAATEIRTSTGKTRKLGPVLAQRIWDYLAPTN
jgi:ERCC4-type nuclease